GTGYYESGTLSVLLGRSDGTFLATRTLDAATPDSVVVGDFNGDGNEDIVIAEFYGIGGGTHFYSYCELRVFLGNGDGTFHAGQTYSEGGTALALTVADINADGSL